MKTIFNKIYVSKSEYSMFKIMRTSDQLRWLFETYDAAITQTNTLDLSKFFNDIKENLEQYNTSLLEYDNNTHMIQNDLPADNSIDFVDVLVDDKNILLESNSLKALRYVKNKFFESGYMLQRDLATEKLFRKDKTTRYIRVFRIINHVNSMCLN
ncbi:MAG: hypothetical protein EBT26_07600 [Microbacteriaceae bacterium]|nr:hypothetical protein [Microbacteriaceae bacterium]